MAAMGACAVALALALDASASISQADWRLQVEATAAALESEAVARSVENGEGVAVAALGFTEHVTLMAPWAVLRSRGDARAFAGRLRASDRPDGSFTDIAQAIDAAVSLLAAVPCEPERRVIDLSTDGKPSAGMGSTTAARDRAAEAGATVNAIGVGDELEGWLRDNAATPGGFTVESADWSQYARSVARKIQSEIAGLPP